MSERKEYYMGYWDWDCEDHDSIGFYDDFEKLKRDIKKRFREDVWNDIYIFKVKLNELFNDSVYNCEKIKEWWLK
jgi:hypothetical protein